MFTTRKDDFYFDIENKTTLQNNQFMASKTRHFNETDALNFFGVNQAFAYSSTKPFETASCKAFTSRCNYNNQPTKETQSTMSSRPSKVVGRPLSSLKVETPYKLDSMSKIIKSRQF